MALPTPIAVNHVVRAVFWQRLFDQRILSVFHLRCFTAPATDYTAAMSALANRLADQAAFPLAQWKPIVGASLLFDSVRVQRVNPTRDYYLENAIGTTGTHADDTNMSIDAVSIEKRARLADRPGIGRLQMAGVPKSKVIAGKLDPTYAGLVQVAWGGLTGQVTIPGSPDTYNWCLWGDGAADLSNDIFTIQTKDTVRTMHRRTVGLGI